MEKLPEDPILTFHDDTLNEIRKIYNYDKPGAMDTAIDILEEWLKKQDHFVIKDFNREYLERFIIRNKGSIERAKQRLDRMCTARTMSPELFNDRNIEDFRLDIMIDAMLPKLTSDFYRVYVVENIGQVFSYEIFLKYYFRTFHFVEYTCAHDYYKGVIVILDKRKSNIAEMIKNNDINLLHKVVNFLQKGYGPRLKSIHLISASKLIHFFISIMKQVFSDKAMNRVYVHNDIETLYKHVDKDILPKEYGGNEKSLKELNEKWLDLFETEEHKACMKKMNAAITNESLRKTDESNNQYLGIPGTFRSLTVD